MKIQLPLENWADLLPFVPRHQLVEIIKQLGDRQFVSILQFFLTKEGKITLGYLRIAAPRENDPNGGGPIVEVRKKMPVPHLHPPLRFPSNLDLETNLPEGPMPTNVKDFKLIELSYFDMSVANFLRHFQREQQPGNSLLDNVNLGFSSTLSAHDDNTIMPILAQLMPMIGNINSMFITYQCNLHNMEFGHIGLEPNNAASQLLTTMLTNTKILEIRYCMHESTFPWCDWLYAPRNDGKPRVLRLFATVQDTEDLFEQIKKDFLKDIRPVSFFVYVRTFVEVANIHWQQDTCLDNGQTNERLIVKTTGSPPPRNPHPFHIYKKFVLISRYPLGANQEWIEANEKEIMEWTHEQNRRIHFAQSLEQTAGGNV